MTDKLMDFVCRTIGCTSIFAKRWEWPHRRVCMPLLLTKEERRRNRNASIRRHHA